MTILFILIAIALAFDLAFLWFAWLQDIEEEDETDDYFRNFN